MEMERWEFLLLLVRYYGTERIGIDEQLSAAALREVETLLGTVMTDTGFESLWHKGKLAAASGRLLDQEQLLKKALWQAKKELGVGDLRLGVLLLDLSDCLEAQANAKAEEADRYFLQAGKILVKNARRMGIVPVCEK